MYTACPVCGRLYGADQPQLNILMKEHTVLNDVKTGREDRCVAEEICYPSGEDFPIFIDQPSKTGCEDANEEQK